MIESSGGGIGKAAEQLLQELQKTQTDAQSRSAAAPGGANEAFQNALQQAQGPTSVRAPQPVTSVPQAQDVLLHAKLAANVPAARVGEAAQTERGRTAHMLDQLIGGQDKMVQIMRLALSGKQFNAQELLALQASVYRFSQELDLTSKVIEKATSGIKQTMNTQV